MKPLMTDGVKRSNYRFRFHPNSSTDPDVADLTYVVGGSAVLSIAYQSAGLWLVTLRQRHTKVMVQTQLHMATSPGTTYYAVPYGVTEGMAADNSFYVLANLAAATYAATTWIDVNVEVEDS